MSAETNFMQNIIFDKMKLILLMNLYNQSTAHHYFCDIIDTWLTMKIYHNRREARQYLPLWIYYNISILVSKLKISNIGIDRDDKAAKPL